MEQKEFLERLDQKRIIDAIAEAESRTSGEIRVHVQPKTGDDIRNVAERTFERLGMTKTNLRTGVLLFIASEENRFVILGDVAIHEKVGNAFWNEIAGELSGAFREGKFTEGIVRAIERAGTALAEYFPHQSDDENELTNEVSISDE